jgi:hypothetical protein
MLSTKALLVSPLNDSFAEHHVPLQSLRKRHTLDELRGGCNMKALSLGLFLAITTFSNAHAQRSPESLPAMTVDCYQSFAAKTQLPELPSKEIAISGGDFEAPLIRYRLQVADKTTLKIMAAPDAPWRLQRHALGHPVHSLERSRPDA